MDDTQKPPVFDEAQNAKNDEVLPIHAPIKVLRYRTIKKNNSLGWWSAVVLLEDHDKKQVCFYRWKRHDKEWKRVKKLPIKSRAEWATIKEAVEAFLPELE